MCIRDRGNTALKPTIQPNAEGQLSNNKFTITVPDQPDVEVYYQIYPNRSAGQISSAEYPDKENGILYDPAGQKEIAYPTGVYEQVTVIAITYPKSGSAMKASEPEIVTYTPENLVAPEAPQLVIGESEAEFVGGDLYDDGQIFKFRYTANTAGGEPHRVYYTCLLYTSGRETAAVWAQAAAVYRPAVGRLLAACGRARAEAVCGKASPEAFLAALRAENSAALRAGAQKLTTGYAFEDLVVGPACERQLRDLCAMARVRSACLLYTSRCV